MDRAIRIRRAIFQRTLVELRKLEVFGFKAVRVNDQDAGLFEIGKVRDQRGRVHANECIKPIARRENFFG